MLKFVKIIDEMQGLCDVGVGTNEKFYASIGMAKKDVTKSEIDNQYYLTEKLITTDYEEKKALKKELERINDIKSQIEVVENRQKRSLRELILSPNETSKQIL